MRNLLCAFILVVVVLSVSPSPAKDIWVVTDKGPVTYFENGLPAGALVTLAKEMLERAGYPDYKIDIYPWARSYNLALRKKNVMILPISRTVKRESLFHWVGIVLNSRSAFIRLKSAEQIEINSFEDARKFRVGVVNSDTQHQLLKKYGVRQIFAVPLPELLLRMLDKGRVDVITMTEDMLPYWCLEKGHDLNDYHIEHRIKNKGKTLYAAFSTITGFEIVYAVQDALEEMKADGTYDEILKDRAN